jgi:hypothetical protein
MASVDDDMLGSYKEALKSPEAAEWLAAMADEINSLRRNNTYTLVPRQPGRKVIGMRWLFKKKHLANGEIERLKARLVAKGYTQRHGIDFFETFAPVCCPKGLHTLIAFAVAEDLEIHAVYIDMAFLHTTLKDKTYTKQLEGFVDPEHPNWVCKLNKSLYSLKQVPLEWFKMIDAHLRANGYEPTEADLCIYIQQLKGLTSFIALYVNDCTIIAHRSQVCEIKEMIKHKFPTKDLGKAKSILGFEIHCNWSQGRIYILQQGKIDDILKMFGLIDCKPVLTLMLTSTALDKPTDNDLIPDFPY